MESIEVRHAKKYIERHGLQGAIERVDAIRKGYEWSGLDTTHINGVALTLKVHGEDLAKEVTHNH